MSIEEIKNEIIKYSKKSLELEFKREERIRKSIYPMLYFDMIALFATPCILIQFAIILPELANKLFFVGIWLELWLICSFIFLISANEVKKETYLRTPKEITSHIVNHDEYSKRNAYQDQEIDDIENILNTLRNNNNNRSEDLFKSTILTIGYIVSAVVFVAII